MQKEKSFMVPVGGNFCFYLTVFSKMFYSKGMGTKLVPTINWLCLLLRAKSAVLLMPAGSLLSPQSTTANSHIYSVLENMPWVKFWK